MNVPPKASLSASPVVELRQYTLKLGQRETLIDLFDSKLIDGQEKAGMTIIGQFRDLDRPDMFVWLRGFDSMEARKNALTCFYDGPVWAAHRDAANATMIDSDNVLLLKPAWPGAAFDLSGLQRNGTPHPEKSNGGNRLTDLVAIRIHHLRSGTEAEFARHFEIVAAQLLGALGARVLGAFVTEHAENSFPRLPVRADENVFITFTSFNSADAHALHEGSLSTSSKWHQFQQAVEADLARPSETLRLSPTSQSQLGSESTCLISHD
ncbi:NIPSNAP family protein [Mesorhizobium sp. PAMC28654]|uniref:NIPSNAP family protein n=1 Tax=Mesorhizobium sp. PAMC28654 TaxID=2880934 RepID=UPI001D0BD9F0|nr:NIPSNAP family protein [Mesorhizobium sp. PAMC28654]UDL91363.1 NIPSNAP family protein [Mesorhizobium sp. PAMC28654]